MDIEKLYETINNDLVSESMKKFESKEVYLKWNQKIYEEHGYKSYGLKVPEIENIVKKYINQFKDLSLTERFTLARKFYKSDYIAQTNFGLKLLEISIPQLKTQDFEFLDEILNYITHWGPTDSFSLNIMQSLLKEYTNETKRLIQKWNNSDHIWKKRASIVIFTRKIGAGGKYVDFLLELCDNLMWDNEDLVRKAVGWALKDNMIGRNKEKVLNYVKNLRKMGVSSTITLYAIRKLKGKERELILNIKPSK